MSGVLLLSLQNPSKQGYPQRTCPLDARATFKDNLLAAVDPPAKSLTFLGGFSGKHHYVPKS